MSNAVADTSLHTHLVHYQSTNDDWEHAALAKELHRWTGIFGAEWKLKLPHEPVLHFDSIRNAYAMYEWGAGSIGTPDNITFNTGTLDRPAAHIVRTHGHELLHFWQHYHGKPSAQRNYHNDEYVRKALDCGILIDHQGCTSGHTEVFSSLIEKHGIDLPDVQIPLGGMLIAPTGGIEPKVYGTRGAAGGGSKMRLWRCGCTNIRAAVDLRVLCRKCGKTFRRAS